MPYENWTTTPFAILTPTQWIDYNATMITATSLRLLISNGSANYIASRTEAQFTTRCNSISFSGDPTSYVFGATTSELFTFAISPWLVLTSPGGAYFGRNPGGYSALGMCSLLNSTGSLVGGVCGRPQTLTVPLYYGSTDGGRYFFNTSTPFAAVFPLGYVPGGLHIQCDFSNHPKL